MAQKRGTPAPIPAQLTHADYHWDEKRHQRLPITKDEESLPAVVLKDFTALEYYFDPVRKDLFLYATEHRIVRVNNTDGIEQNNKLAVPLSASGSVVAVRARTISPRGEVVEVQPESMKELKNEDNAGYRIFALDGVEVGSEVEYYYTRERPGNHFGREFLQTGTATHNETFELISPEGLTFDTKLYNPADASKKEEKVDAGKRIITYQFADVPGLRKEEFAEVAAHRMRVEYKLAYMANKGDARQFTWADASQFLYKMVYKTDKEEAKAIATALKAANVPATAPLPERIAAAEQYVKLNFNLDPAASDDLSRVVATRNAPEIGFVRLLAGMYRALGIGFELAVTTDRTELPFDGSFDTWGYLDDFILYFPATKQYLAPARPDTRLGLIPAEWTANPGLFVKTVTLGSTESAVGAVREVPAMPASASTHEMDVQVKFNADLDKATVQLKQVFGGYQGQPLQAVYARVPPDKQPEIMRELQKGRGARCHVYQKRGAQRRARPERPAQALRHREHPRKHQPARQGRPALFIQNRHPYRPPNGAVPAAGPALRRRKLASTGSTCGGWPLSCRPATRPATCTDLNIDVKTGPSATAPAYLFPLRLRAEGAAAGSEASRKATSRCTGPKRTSRPSARW